ncbi:MAG: tRNA pseudouridine13 synthase, partial [Planctomycetota bacterium]
MVPKLKSPWRSSKSNRLDGVAFELPYLTASIPPLPGVLKQCAEDFRVEELPLYELTGEGDHLFFEIEKRGMTTNTLVRRLASELKVPTTSIGYAGLKDARAVTRQLLSVEHVAAEIVEQLVIEDTQVLWTKRHSNKLKRGHLLGNRFRIVLRECDSARIQDVRKIFRELERTGLPNAFGPQRFGARGDSDKIGRALIDGNHREVVDLIAGRPNELDFGAVRDARELFEAGEYELASKTWPRGYELSSKISFAMHKNRGRASRATRSLSKREKGFYVSAWQAACFNRVLAERMPAIDKLHEGEFAWNHGGRRPFQVRDLNLERARALLFEVSPAGPLFGPASSLSTGEIGERESSVLGENGLQLDQLEPRRF